jgi:hypothetical protein
MRNSTLTLLAAIGLAMIAVNAQAEVGLGWTLPEAIKHLGQPTSEPQPDGIGKMHYDFEVKGLAFRAFFLEGRIGGISISQSTSFDGQFIKAFFLSDAGPEATWDGPTRKDDGALSWVGKVGDRIAYWASVNANGNILSIVTQEYLQSDNLSESTK